MSYKCMYVHVSTVYDEISTNAILILMSQLFPQAPIIIRGRHAAHAYDSNTFFFNFTIHAHVHVNAYNIIPTWMCHTSSGL